MPWFLCVFAAAFAVALTWRTRRRTGLAAAAGLLAAAVALWPGRAEAERMLTDLALPVGAAWFALLAFAAGAAVRRRLPLAVAFLVPWALLTAAGSYEVAGRLTSLLEDDYRGIDPFAAGPFDAVCVLGGGAWTAPGGRVTVRDAGDRLVVAAKLFRTGDTPRLVCGGGDLKPSPDSPTVAEMSAAVLRDLGVPADAIVLAGGHNTATEMETYAKLVEERGWKRVGLVTSAWHLRRAERLATAAGLHADPLPADFRSGAADRLPFPESVRQFTLVPAAGAIALTHAAAKEHLARLVGR